MAIKSMKLSWIVSSDLKKTKEFFVNKLGLELSNDAPEFGWMELVGKEGGMYLGVGQADPNEHPDQEAGMNAVVTFTVDNIEESIKELTAKGVQFIDEVMEVPGHVKMITFVDPDGNMFQLVEELS